MQSNWAADNLQVIRTLMERSSLYRRALAPIMTASGSIGLGAAIIPCFSPIHSISGFVLFWMVVAVVASLVAFVLVRRQALKDKEPLWSSPTRRVAQAIMPAFFVGSVFALSRLMSKDSAVWLLPVVWLICYGAGLHAAGAFMPRGIRLFGWSFVLSGCALLWITPGEPRLQSAEAGHYIMGIFFGLLHLAYGIYLYFTEKRKNAA